VGRVTFLALSLILAGIARGHDDEPILRLERVPSFQVSASLNGPVAAKLSLEALEAPFMEVLRKRGKRIDQNNYENDVGTFVDIASSGVDYAVNIHFEYRELCTIKRLNLDLTCPVWERYEPVKMFSSLDDAVAYVMTITKTAARLFDAEMERH
jgi:hypothetical protein